MMATPDLDVIKEIPGYKVILKAVLKSQIQQLVEQLARNTDEESVILTASVADGTLSHLGSESGKGFLEDHEDIKSQFLGFCLKKHHRKKQAEKERQEAEALQLSMQQASPARYGGPMGGPFAGRSPRFPSPRGQGPIHPVSLTRISPGAARSPGVRHEPYPMARPKRPSLNFDQGQGPSTLQLPAGNKGNGQVIKIEPDDDETSNQSESGSVSQDKPSSTSQSPSQQAISRAKSESDDKDDDAKSESSISTIVNDQPPEGLSLDTDLSNLISEQSQQQSRHDSESGDMDPNVSIKLESLTESEMELEITGVEPGRLPMSQNNWDPNVSMGMNFDPTGATGSQADMAAQGYNEKQHAKRGRPKGSKTRTKVRDDNIVDTDSDNVITTSSETLESPGDGSLRGIHDKTEEDEEDEDLSSIEKGKITKIRGTYRRFSMNQKASVVNYAKLHGVRASARKYGIAKSTIDGWVKLDYSHINPEAEDSLDFEVKESEKLHCSSVFEVKICEYLAKQQRSGEKITTDMITTYAKQILHSVSPNYSVTQSWVLSFLRNHQTFLKDNNIEVSN